MNGLNRLIRDMAAVIVPLIILALLVPALISTDVSNRLKGLCIGVYLSLSIIGVINIWRDSQQED